MKSIQRFLEEKKALTKLDLRKLNKRGWFGFGDKKPSKPGKIIGAPANAWKNLPPVIFDYVEKDRIKELHKEYSEFSWYELEHWKEYHGDIYQAQVNIIYPTKAKMYIFATDGGGNYWGYSFADKHIYCWAHEDIGWTYFAVRDKKWRDSKLYRDEEHAKQFHGDPNMTMGDAYPGKTPNRNYMDYRYRIDDWVKNLGIWDSKEGDYYAQ